MSRPPVTPAGGPFFERTMAGFFSYQFGCCRFRPWLGRGWYASGRQNADGDQDGKAGDKQDPGILFDDVHGLGAPPIFGFFLPDATRNILASSVEETVTNRAWNSVDLHQ
jgi:hypothetical protein